jgi:4-alpha-glucanotransferase
VSPLDADLAALARFHGVQTAYDDVRGCRQEAAPDVVVALLRALGVPLDSPADAGRLLREQQHDADRRRLEPVVVHRIGRPDAVTVTLPAVPGSEKVWLTLELEDGDLGRAALGRARAGRPRAVVTAGGTRSVVAPINLAAVAGRPLPPGRHRLTLEGAGAAESALVLSAPDCPQAPRWLGAFMPLHAIRADGDWGVGTYPELGRLGEWVSRCGVDVLGTLPLYPAFLEPPADPSPYLPVSRLAYNEIYVDPTALPEFTACDEARQRWGSAHARVQAASRRSPRRVPYEEVVRLIRAVLEPMAACLQHGCRPERQAGLRDFARRHPELEAYARFRARAEKDRTDTDADLSAVTYHLYCQWAANEQLHAAGRAAPQYADFPIGSHPRGFDPEWSPVSFIPGVHGGAPPDRFFPGGQDWGFRPLHPERIREDGYRFLSAALARAFRHAACVRIDHIMGLQRLFMIPEGAGGGAYVAYAVEELDALVALEAHRAGTVVVGEDLGTVPDEVRPRMERDRMLRTWVFQFESSEDVPLPEPPASCLAALGTHDLPRFAAYLWAEDVTERAQRGMLTPDEASAEQTARGAWRRRLLHALGVSEDRDVAAITAAALEGCLTHLARSDAAITLVDLEELWGERAQQNVPGTGPEAENWRRRGALSLEELRADDRLAALLEELARERAA